MATKTLDEIPEELWQIACVRETVIRPLVVRSRLDREEIDTAATALGIRRAYLYRLVAAYRKRPQTSTLVPKQPGRPHRTRLLDPKVEAVIQTAITGFTLPRSGQESPI
jgi:putative transposase